MNYVSKIIHLYIFFGTYNKFENINIYKIDLCTSISMISWLLKYTWFNIYYLYSEIFVGDLRFFYESVFTFLIYDRLLVLELILTEPIYSDEIWFQLMRSVRADFIFKLILHFWLSKGNSYRNISQWKGAFTCHKIFNMFLSPSKIGSKKWKN